MNTASEPIVILHVDDDPEFLDLTVSHLQQLRENFTVKTATSVSDAHNRLAANDIDCIVADYDIPDTTGLDFLGTVREEYPDLPFILFTGKGSEAVASQAISSGVTDYLQKQTGSEQFTILANRIENAVESARAKAAARRSKDRLQSLAAAFPDVAFLIDETGRYLEVLAGEASPLLYADADQLRGSSFEDHLTSETAQRFTDIVKTAIETGEIQTIEYELEVLAGERHFEARVAPMETTEMTRQAVVWVARDITGHVEREQRFRTLHTVANELVTCTDPDEVYEVLVESAEAVLEYDHAIADAAIDDVLVPKAISTAVGDEAYFEETPIDAEDNLAAEAYRTGDSLLVDDLVAEDVTPADDRYRAVLTVPIGEHGVFQTVSSEVGAFDEADRELVETLVSHGVTTLERLEREQSLQARTEELEEQNERLDEFVSIVSHDLRTPLGVARGRLALAMEECDSPHLADVEQAHDRMETLIDDLLAVAREGEAAIEWESVELGAVAEACWEAIETAEATLVLDTDAVVRADRERLTQLLENLVSNAVEHGGTAVTVTVGVHGEGFYVADDGPGIPDEMHERVFEAGFSTADDGTGFGLRIVHQIADAHGWDVTVTDSEAGGARFEIHGVEFAGE